MGRNSQNAFAIKALRRLLSDRSGATAIEYAIILSMMTLAIVGAMAATGTGVQDGWNAMAAKVVAVLK